MGDFGQILFYYLLQKDSGYFSETGPTALTIFHTLDTWAASICSLFANGVICEQSSDSLSQDEGNLPYKFGNNKMFVSKTLKDKLIYTMTPSIYLPTVDGDEEYHDIWSKIPLTKGQIQEWNKFIAEHEKKILNLNQQLNEDKEKHEDNEKNYIRRYEVLEYTVIESLKAEQSWEQQKLSYMAQGKMESARLVEHFINELQIITKKAKNELGEEKIQQLVTTLRESESIIKKKEQEITTTIYELSVIINNDSKKRERDSGSNIAIPSLPNSSAAVEASVSDPTSKKQKIVGGVMTRSMVLKQELLNQQILKQKQLDQQIESSFDNIDEQITDLKDSTLEFKTFIEKNREQLEKLNLPIPELPNLDIDSGPISSRTRSKIALAKKQLEEKQSIQQQQSALPLPARARPLQQSQFTAPPSQQSSKKRGKESRWN